MADKKISELTNITGANLANNDEFVVVDVSADETKAVTREEFFKSIPSVDINGGSIDGTVIGGTTPAAISGTTGQFGTSLNVDGTVTADGLVVDGANARADFGDTVTFQSANNTVGISDNAFFDGTWKYKTTAAASLISSFRGSQPFRVRIANSGTAGSDVTWRDAMQIAQNGDISFYEDTGTTPKFFWDASTERLGLGTVNPGTPLAVRGLPDGNDQFLRLDNNKYGSTDTSGETGILFGWLNHAAASIKAYKDAGAINRTGFIFNVEAGFNTPVEAVRITSFGNVGIGTAVPQAQLQIAGPDNAVVLKVSGTTQSSGMLSLGDGSSTSNNVGVYRGAAASVSNGNFLNLGGFSGIAFTTGSAALGSQTERLRITDTGSVGIGTSSPTAVLDVRGSAFVIGAGGTRTTDTANGNGFEVVPGPTNNLLSFNRSTSGYLPVRYRAGVQSWEVDNVERMRITSTGNVGIGTSSPARQLSVFASSGDGFIQIANATTGSAFNDGFQLSAQAGTGDAILNNLESTNMKFFVANTERARIDASGNLLVGTTSATPSASNVVGFSVAAAGAISLTGSATSAIDCNRTNDGIVQAFRRGGVFVGSISVTASATSYNTSSDYRLKEDVQPMVGASDRVLSLKPCNFAWKADGTRVDGFLAHEAQAVVPEAVTGDKDGEEMQAIDQSKLVPLLTAALQEALQKIDALEARITALEA